MVRGGGDYSREAIISNISVKGGDYSREVIDRGTAIIRGNTVSHTPALSAATLCIAGYKANKPGKYESCSTKQLLKTA